MAKIKMTAVVTGQEQLTEDIFDMRIKAAQVAEDAVPGQFVSLYTKDGAKLLPRPISLCGIDREAGELRLVYRIAGAGTKEFSQLKAGDTIDVLGPLGNGFPMEPGKKAFLIGGGIGIPPMLELAKALAEANARLDGGALAQAGAQLAGSASAQAGAQPAGSALAQAGAQPDGGLPEQDGGRTGLVQSILGYRDSQMFLKHEFAAFGPVHVATEDGSAGTAGNVLDAIREQGLSADIIYACGPTPMLRALKAYAAELGIPCFLSLEEKMACGVGACLACVCQSKDVDGHSQVHNKRIYKDGPVFLADEIEL